MKGNGETNIRVTARGGFVQRCAKIITYIPVLKNYIYSHYLEKIGSSFNFFVPKIIHPVDF
jgi:hypothetical protein